MDIKNSVSFLKSVVAAGFSLANSKSIQTHDGSCWHATLVKEKTKLVTVSNDGYGGPDEFRYESGPVNAILAGFYALPVVQDFARNEAIREAEMDVKYNDLTAVEFEARKVAILAGTPIVSEDVLGSLVAEFCDTKDLVAKLKRKIKTNICWIQHDSDDGSYVSIKGLDTPENRVNIVKRYGKDIDVFIADLIVGL